VEPRQKDPNSQRTRFSDHYSRSTNNLDRSSRSDRSLIRNRDRRSRSRSRSRSKNRGSRRSRSRSNRRRESSSRYENNTSNRPVQRANNYTRRRHISKSKSPNENKENNSEKKVASPKEAVNKYVQTTLIPVFYSKEEQVSNSPLFYLFQK